MGVEIIKALGFVGAMTLAYMIPFSIGLFAMWKLLFEPWAKDIDRRRKDLDRRIRERQQREARP